MGTKTCTLQNSSRRIARSNVTTASFSSCLSSQTLDQNTSWPTYVPRSACFWAKWQKTYGESPRNLSPRCQIPADGRVYQWKTRNSSSSSGKVRHPQLVFQLLLVSADSTAAKAENKPIRTAPRRHSRRHTPAISIPDHHLRVIKRKVYDRSSLKCQFW